MTFLICFLSKNHSAVSSVQSFATEVEVNNFIPGLIKTLTDDDQLVVDTVITLDLLQIFGSNS